MNKTSVVFPYIQRSKHLFIHWVICTAVCLLSSTSTDTHTLANILLLQYICRDFYADPLWLLIHTVSFTTQPNATLLQQSQKTLFKASTLSGIFLSLSVLLESSGSCKDKSKVRCLLRLTPTLSLAYDVWALSDLAPSDDMGSCRQTAWNDFYLLLMVILRCKGIGTRTCRGCVTLCGQL